MIRSLLIVLLIDKWRLLILSDAMSDKKHVGRIGRRSYMKAAVATGLVGTGLASTGSAAAHETGEANGSNTERDTNRSNDEILVNVGYENGNGEKEVADIAEEVVEECSPISAVTVKAKSASLSNLRESDNIRYVEVCQAVQATQQTVPWGIERVDAPVAHEAGETGLNANVAIIDTGIDSTHEDLEANLGEGVAFIPCAGDCDEPWDDDNGHGTHVAGTVGARDNDIGVVGVAPCCTLHAVKVLDQFGRGFDFTVAAGIIWAAEQGVDVANLSLGSAVQSQMIEEAVEYAYNEGVLLVGAAGNRGPCEDCVDWPAAYDEVIAVSATSEDDSLAWFSSTGPEVELAAPGEGILSTLPEDEYGFRSGTSMAAPHVSGAGALLMANGFSNVEARERLQETAEDIGLDETEQGFGLVDVAAALDL